MARFKVVLTVINEDSVSPFVVGPRFRRGTPMPMEKIYAERNGYWFDPESEIDMARDLAEQFASYLQNAETKKKKKKP
jgi:GAF domain-containing protein